MNQLEKAYAEWNGRREGDRFPEGSGYIWYPTTAERQLCCESIREPSNKYPNSLRTHCNSAKHVAKLFRVDRKDLLAMHKRLTASNYEPKEIVSPKSGDEWGWF